MHAGVLEAAGALRAALLACDPRVLTGADCARLAEELASTEKACTAVRLLAAARAVECGAHKDRGFKDGASWLARQSGTTSGQARQALETAEKLDDCPNTKTALLSGEISLAQAHEITETPTGESDLLAAARNGDLSQVRQAAREHRQATTEPAELRRRQFALREFRHWQDREGMSDSPAPCHRRPACHWFAGSRLSPFGCVAQRAQPPTRPALRTRTPRSSSNTSKPTPPTRSPISSPLLAAALKPGRAARMRIW